MSVEVTQAGPDRLSAVACVLGRAFVTEPMARWPLGVHGDVERRFIRFFEYFLEGWMGLGIAWEAGEALGAAIWIPPDKAEVWGEGIERSRPKVHALTEDGGRRYDAFWEWCAANVPHEPLWHLDSVGVAPEAQGHGIGSALIESGLARVKADESGAFLETGTPRNVPYYERFGFRVVTDADAPDGGPHFWFMRWDP